MASLSSLLRDLLSADDFKSHRKKTDNSAGRGRATDNKHAAADRRPTKPARSQSDVLTYSRLRDANIVNGYNGNRDGGGEDKMSRRRPSASVMNGRSNRNIGTAGSGAAALARMTCCTSCVGESDHRAMLDLRVTVQIVERAAAAKGNLDLRDLKRTPSGCTPWRPSMPRRRVR